MAVISGTVMAVKTVAKMLLKKLSKKAIKKAVTKGVKKKVKGKIKDKLMGKKKDRRQKAKNIMQEHGEFAGGGALVSTPTTALIPKPSDKGGALAVIDKKDGGGGPLDFKKMGEKIDNIVGMTDAIAMLTGVEKDQAKEQADARRIAKAKAEKKAREAKLKAKKGGVNVPGFVKKPAQSLLDMMMKFLVNVALGTIILSIIKLIKDAKKIWTGFKEGFEKFFWIIRALLWKGFIPKTLLQGITKGVKLLGTVVKGAVKGTLAPFKAVGSTIFNAFKSATGSISKWIGGIGSKLKNVVVNAAKGLGKMASRIPGVKQTANFVKGVAGKVSGGLNAAKTFVGSNVSKAKDFVGKGVQGVKGFLGKGVQGAKGFLGKGVKGLKGVLGIGGKAGKVGGVLSKAGKVGGKLAKGAAGILSKAKGLFGRIPIIGPLMVALASVLGGDPPKQTLFKAMGAALGGLAGSFIPIPVVGTILGEMTGEFVGDLFYTLVSGGGWEGVVEKTKAKAKQIFEGGKAAVDWVGGGIKRFTTNFLKETAIEIPEGGGRWAAMTKIAEVLGLKDWLKGIGYVNGDGMVTKFPNLLQLLNPFKYGPILIKSFFPPGEKKESSSAEVSGGSSKAEIGPTSVDAGGDAVAQDDPTQEEGGDTIILGGSGSSGGSGSGGGGGVQVALVGSKDALNSYVKAMNSKSLSSV
tara:strand:+ start:473 stop:2539 length:2067 start_codon:yes stop_codon:yes gene_type:complete